jgi:hypothetical protein
MANFLVSFRIESDATYQDRYDSLDKAMKTLALEPPWEETSSLYVFAAIGNANSVCASLYHNSLLLESKDQLLVIDLGERKHETRGVKYPNTLKKNLGF